MFKKIAIHGSGYPALSLVYWLRRLTSRVEIFVEEGEWIHETFSLRGWPRGERPFSPMLLSLSARRLPREGRSSGALAVEVITPRLSLDGEDYPLYSRRGLTLMERKGCKEVEGPGSEQLSKYLSRARRGEKMYKKCVVSGETLFKIHRVGEIRVENPFDEEVEQAAAKAALEILGIPSGEPLGFKVIEDGSSYDFVIGHAEYERSTKVLLGKCHVRIGIVGEEVVHVSGKRCGRAAIINSIQLFMGKEASGWMPLLASSRSPLLREERLLRALLGLWRKSLPRRLLQIGELGVPV